MQKTNEQMPVTLIIHSEKFEIFISGPHWTCLFLTNAGGRFCWLEQYFVDSISKQMWSENICFENSLLTF